MNKLTLAAQTIKENAMDNYVVYMHITPNGKKYIGITCKKPQQRWANGRGYVKNTYFFKAIVKYGWDNIQHIIIAENLSKDAACSLEIALISGCKTTDPMYGYNISTGGESGTNGVKYGVEFRQKVRDRMLGPANPMRGKRASKETKQRQSIARKGQWSEKQQKALRNTWDANRKKVICIETKEIYASASDAANQNGVTERCIRDACLGRQKRSNGFHWEYYNEGKDYSIKDYPVYCIETKIAYASNREAARRFSVDTYEFCKHVGKKSTIIPGRHWKVFNESKDDYVMYVR